MRTDCEIKDLELLELFDYSMSFAEAHVKENGDLAPMISCVSSKNEQNYVMFVPFEDSEEKVRVLTILKVFFVAYDIDKYVFMNEAWMVREEKDKPTSDHYKPGYASNHPNRIEALMVLGVSHKEKYGGVREMIRDETGKLIELKEVGLDATGFGGSFTELLPPPGLNTPDEVKEKMKKSLKEVYKELVVEDNSTRTN